MRKTWRWFPFLLALSGLACGNTGDTSLGSSSAPAPSPSPVASPTPLPSPSATPKPQGPGQLYCLMASNEANQGGKILHFSNAGNLTGQVAPLATISGPATGIGALTDLEVDPANNRLYAANSPTGATVGNILVWDQISTRQGNVPPDRVISLGISPVSVSYDGVRDVLYVGTSSAGVLRVYGASTANGSIPSGLGITGSLNGLPLFPFGIQVDGASDRLFVSSCTVTGLSGAPVVASYDNAFSISGAALISRTLTSASNPFSTTIDSAGRLVVNDAVVPFVPGVQMSSQERILAFPGAATASGNPAPTVTITGAAQTVGAHRLNYDFANDALVVANTNKVLFFDRFSSTTGTVAATSARSLDLSQFTTASNTTAGLIFGCTDAAVDPTR